MCNVFAFFFLMEDLGKENEGILSDKVPPEIELKLDMGYQSGIRSKESCAVHYPWVNGSRVH